MQEVNTRIQLKRDTEDNWIANDPVLLKGEIAIVDSPDFDGQRFKVGDGVSTYSALPFADENLYACVDDLYNKVQDVDETRLEKVNGSTQVGWTQDGLVVTDIDAQQLEYGMRLYGDDEAANVGAKNGSGTTNYRFVARGEVEYNVATEEEVAELLENKVDKVDGKGLSTNDFTTNEKNKLNSIHYGAVADESHLEWGTSHLASKTSPVDAAMIASLGANRIAFMPTEDILIEYSRDGGVTWLDYESTDAAKTDLVSGIGTPIYLGKWVQGETATTDWKLRITLTATDTKVYFKCRKAVMQISTAGAQQCTVMIEKATIGDPDTFTTILPAQAVSGWSGWNVLNLSNLPSDDASFGGASYQTNQSRKLRFTFEFGGTMDDYANNFCVLQLQMFGENAWSFPSNMAKNGHIYSYDANRVTYFPNSVAAPYFSGAASKAINDGQNNNIVGTYLKQTTAAETYATKDELKEVSSIDTSELLTRTEFEEYMAGVNFGFAADESDMTTTYTDIATLTAKLSARLEGNS